MTPSKYAPYKIRNSMFLPLMKKALMGGIGGRRQKTKLSLFILRKSAFFSWKFFSRPSDVINLIMPPIIFFCPPPLKIESGPDEKILDTPDFSLFSS